MQFMGSFHALCIKSCMFDVRFHMILIGAVVDLALASRVGTQSPSVQDTISVMLASEPRDGQQHIKDIWCT